MTSPQWKITLHWTAGTHKVSPLDLRHYHFIYDGEGNEHKGVYDIDNNIPPYTKGYAAHCSKANAYNIGLSMACMAGFNAFKKNSPYMMTRTQFEAMCSKAAELHLNPKYKVPIQNIKTHFERGIDDKSAGKQTDNIGKIDIVYLPFEPNLAALEVGTYIRSKILWYAKKKIQL